MIAPLAHPQRAALVNIFMPCELLHAFHLLPMFAEATACYLNGAAAERGFIHYAESAGISPTLCSYHKALLGMGLSGTAGKPLFTACTSIACDANNLTFRRLAQHYGIPHFYLDVPYDHDEYAVAEVSDRLREFAAFLEDATHQKLDKAEALLKEMSGMIRPDTLPSLLGEYYYLSALYERFKGNLEESLAKYKKWELILLEYYGKTAMYYNLLMETAITLSRMKRYQEAIEKYREVLAYYESLGVLSECVKARNNLASCYLDMGDAQTALDLLKEAKDHVNSMDPLLHGEIFRNLSRAYRILGDTEKEIPCLLYTSPSPRDRG